MQQYPNYYQQTQYPNSAYQQNPYNQNVYNPYGNFQNQIQNQSAFQNLQQNQNNGMCGRFLDDFGTITANEVPMTGNPAIFIKNDGSLIQLKAWNANGTISTTSYKPIVDDNSDNPTNVQQNSFDVLNEDMRAFREEINARFDKLEKSIGGSSRGRAKKEVEVNQDESI